MQYFSNLIRFLWGFFVNIALALLVVVIGGGLALFGQSNEMSILFGLGLFIALCGAVWAGVMIFVYGAFTVFDE